VLSVHVASQIQPPPNHFTERLLEGIKVFVEREGYEIPPFELVEAIEGDPKDIPQRLHALMISKGYDKPRVDLSMAKGSEMFKAQSEMNGVVLPVDGSGLKCELQERRITDLQAYKKSLKVDDKPMPVQPLETFYESGSPKL
jgi:hypothetical protein